MGSSGVWLRQRLKPQLWYTIPGNISTASATAGELRVAPFLFPAYQIIDQLSVEVTTGGSAGSVLRLTVYDDNGFSYPGNLLYDTGTTASTTTGFKTFTSLSIPVGPGYVWIGGVAQVAAPTLRTTSTYQWPQGTEDPSKASNVSAWRQTSVTGTPPSTFSSSLDSATNAYKVWFRIA